METEWERDTDRSELVVILWRAFNLREVETERERDREMGECRSSKEGKTRRGTRRLDNVASIFQGVFVGADSLCGPTQLIVSIV